MQDGEELTLHDVARQLDVHYQTVYRWVRAGSLPAVRVGRGYVVQARDLDEFVERRSRPASPPPPSEARLDRQRDAMGRALLEGGETSAQSIARQLVSDGTPVTTLIEQVIVPPLIDIGTGWRTGQLPIYVEHRASAIVERLLGEMTPNPRGRRRGRAVVAALAGDVHALPTTMATAALREDNWHVDHLGADMPVDELVAFARHHEVDLVIISATMPQGDLTERTQDLLETRHGIPTLIGGPGATLTELQAAARLANANR